MKKIICLIFGIGLLFSCNEDNLTNLNVDPKSASTVPAATLFTNAEKNLCDQLVTYSSSSNLFRLWAQHWTETTYNDEANYDVIGRDPVDNYWETIYNNVLNDLKSAREIMLADNILTSAEKNNRDAFMSILEVVAYQTLVDISGNVPYTEALDVDNVSPVYDDAQSIYMSLLSKLNDALTNLDSGASSFGSADFLYGGDVDAWKKFGNSVKLRMGMRLADVDATAASTAVSQAYAAGVFSSNADNAVIPYEAAPPNNNPLQDLFVLEGRGSDIIAGKTLVDMMSSLSDPRMAAFFDDNLGSGTYLGGPIGGNNAYGNFTHVNPAIVEDPEFPGTILEYAQVEFLLAEAAERGFIQTPADAEAHYNAGITASFDFWGVSGAAAYLANPAVAYTTAAGDWKQKIGTQKWIALYNEGFEAWNEYRRLDQPTLVEPEQAVFTAVPVPNRIFYPTTEPALNGSNYDAAVQAIGGNDDLATKVFWDVN